MDTISRAAQEYIAKRAQMGSRKAAAHIIQEYGISAADLSLYLSEQGLLLVQNERRATQRPFEVGPL